MCLHAGQTPAKPHQEDEQKVVRGAPLEQLLNRVQDLQGAPLWCSGAVSLFVCSASATSWVCLTASSAAALLLQLHTLTRKLAGQARQPTS